jgi:hypothetical protein
MGYRLTGLRGAGREIGTSEKRSPTGTSLAPPASTPSPGASGAGGAVGAGGVTTDDTNDAPYAE